MKRLTVAALCLLAFLLLPIGAAADDLPYRTVIDHLVPNTPGLTIEGAAGGCDLLIQNQTGQDVLLYDLGKPPKPYRFANQPKSTPPKAPIPVHLTGAWPCASLPAVTEDQRWNHAQATVGSWSILGAVGAVAFKIQARTLYDPALDPAADLMLYARMGAGAIAVGGFLLLVPYLFTRRRDILGARPKAA